MKTKSDSGFMNSALKVITYVALLDSTVSGIPRSSGTKCNQLAGAKLDTFVSIM